MNIEHLRGLFREGMRKARKTPLETTIIESCSNFSKVGDFHNTFGHPIHTTPQKDIFDTEEGRKLLNNRLSFIQEEVNELKDAITNKDFNEVADALVDILYFTYGTGHVLGLDLNSLFDTVHENNMSKACKTEDEARLTIDKLVNTASVSNSPTPDDFIIEKVGEMYIVKNKYTNKIMKSCNWKPPVLNL